MSEDHKNPPSSDEIEDYCGMPLDEWVAALREDMKKRFGDLPENLTPVGEAGW
jgi:hypothetical protein